MVPNIVGTEHNHSTIPIVIGVTGHRDLREADISPLESSVGGLIDSVRRGHPDTPLILLSPLAEGADRLVARVALNRGVRLVVPLPLPIAEYEKDFETAESLAEFRELIGHAEERFELRLLPGISENQIVTGGEQRNLQYAQVGAYIVRHSQVLIALWDGNQPDKEPTGGTAQIVRFKLRGIPDPYTPPTKPLDVIDTGPVSHILTPRQSYPNPEGQPYSLNPRYPGEIDGNRETLKTAYDRILARIDTFNRDVNHLSPSWGEKIQASREGLIPSAYLPRLSQADLAILGQFAVADVLAGYFQKWRRWTLRALFVIAVLAVVSFEVYAHLLTSPWVLILYPVLLGMAFLIYFVAKQRDYQNKYLDYRALAEGLRVQLFWRLAGLREEVADHYLRKQQTELDWIRHAIRACNVQVLRSSVMANQTGSETRDVDRVRALRELVLPHWIEAQFEFFKRRTGDNRRSHEWRESGMNGFFGAGLGIAILVVVLDLYLPRSGFYPGVHHWLIVGMGTMPAIAAALGGFAEKMAFSEQAKRYRWMSGLFERARRKLDEFLEENQLKKAQDLIRDLGKEALVENGDWVMAHREREIDPPRGG